MFKRNVRSESSNSTRTHIIDEEGIQNIVSIDLVTLAQSPPTSSASLADQMEIIHTNGENNVSTQHMEGENYTTSRDEIDMAQGYTTQPNCAHDFVVDTIIRQEGPKNERTYTVHWYGYSEAYYTIKLANHINWSRMNS